MKRIQYIFWLAGLIIWSLWVKERIEIFQYFVDNYKNIGYVVGTNGNQLYWYLLISFFKALLLFGCIYMIIPKFGFTKKALLYTILFLHVFLVLEWGAAKVFLEISPRFSPDNYRVNWDYNLYYVYVSYVLIAVLAWTLSSAYQWVSEYKNLKRLYQDQTSLQRLKEQISPHFIFNTLNSFYEIALSEGHSKLENGILNLTHTLRYTIDYSDKNKVLLSKEIEALNHFIELQKTRFDNNEIALSTHFDIASHEVKITPLIILNYVENAFKHGYKYGKESLIELSVKEVNRQLQLKIRNTNHATSVNADGGNKKIENILKLNYPQNYSLKIDNQPNFYTLELWIRLN